MPGVSPGKTGAIASSSYRSSWGMRTPVLDFQHVETATLADATQLDHVADLASPYGEALLNNHARYRGRIGTPDTPKSILDAIVPNA